jgi:hypothetical protein
MREKKKEKSDNDFIWVKSVHGGPWALPDTKIMGTPSIGYSLVPKVSVGYYYL